MDKYINKVINGDCIEEMKGIPDGVVDLVVTDPPYGINLQPQRQLTDAIKGDLFEEAKPLLINALNEFKRVLKNNTHLLIFGGWSEYWYLEEIKKLFSVKSCIVWVKNNFGIGYYIRPQHEFIWYCHNGKPLKPNKAISNVIYENKVLVPTHSCEKPVKLIRRLLMPFSNSGDIILDPFLGSGTTAVACIETGRRFIGIEINPEYVKIAEKRIAQAYDKKRQVELKI